MRAIYNVFHRHVNGSVTRTGIVTIEIRGNPNDCDNRDAAVSAVGCDPHADVNGGPSRKHWAQFVEYTGWRRWFS